MSQQETGLIAKIMFQSINWSDLQFPPINLYSAPQGKNMKAIRYLAVPMNMHYDDLDEIVLDAESFSDAVLEFEARCLLPSSDDKSIDPDDFTIIHRVIDL